MTKYLKIISAAVFFLFHFGKDVKSQVTTWEKIINNQWG